MALHTINGQIKNSVSINKPVNAGVITNNQIAFTTITGDKIYSLDVSSKNVIADTGTVGGWTLGTTDLSATSGGNTTILSSGVTAFSAGPTGTPTVTITRAGVLNAIGAVISGAITSNSGTIGSFTIGTYLYTGSKTAYNDANAGVHLGSDGIGIGNNIFTVSAAGVMVATSATITGSITSTSGTIGGWTLGATSLVSGAGATTVGLDSGGTNPAIYAGSATPASAPFRVTNAGAVVASNITATGTINATGGYVGSTTALVFESQGINVGTTGYIRGGQTAYNTGTGFFLGYDTSAYKLSIGSANQNLTWDGVNFQIKSNVDNAIAINSGGSLRINDGGDILMRSDVTNPAELRFYTTAAPANYITLYQDSAAADNLVTSWSEVNVTNENYLSSQGSTGNAQSFSNTAAAKITSCKFYLSKYGSPTGNAVAKLYAHSGTYGTSSIPTGAALATSDNFDVSTLTTSLQLITFTFTGAQQYSMSASTNYVISVEYSGGNANNCVVVGVDYDAFGPGHGGNSSTYTAGSWSYATNTDLIFYVYNDQTISTATGILFDASADAITPYVKFDSAITLKTDTIGETTSANGVTIDGLNIKDGIADVQVNGTARKLIWKSGSNAAFGITAGDNDTANSVIDTKFPTALIGAFITGLWVSGSWNFIMRGWSFHQDATNLMIDVHTYSGVNQNISITWVAVGY